jgi:hypothetical protein
MKEKSRESLNAGVDEREEQIEREEKRVVNL